MEKRVPHEQLCGIFQYYENRTENISKKQHRKTCLCHNPLCRLIALVNDLLEFFHILGRYFSAVSILLRKLCQRCDSTLDHSLMII